MDEDVILLFSDSSLPSSPSLCPELKTFIPNLSPVNENIPIFSSCHSLSDSDGECVDRSSEFNKNENYLDTFGVEGSVVQDKNSSFEDLSPSQKKKRRILTPEEKEKLKLEKETAKQMRDIVRDARRKAKELREKERNERAAVALKRRQMKPGECLKFMTIVIDERLFDMVLCQKALEMFPAADVTFSSKLHLTEKSIIWNRTEDGVVREEDFVAVIWVVDQLIEAVKSAKLIESFEAITKKFPGKRISLWIFTLHEYYRLSKNAFYRDLRNDPNAEVSQRKKKKDYLTREEIEMALTELQIMAGVSHRNFENYSDFSNLLFQFTKSIAEAPFRKEREKLDSRASWFCRGESRDCVRIDKDMNGLDRLWLQQLSQFNNTSIDTVKAISSLYSTPHALYQAYEKCSSQKEKESLLQDIIVKRSNSASAATRKLGPELSRRVCLMFSQENGDLLLSQES